MALSYGEVYELTLIIIESTDVSTEDRNGHGYRSLPRPRPRARHRG